MTTRASGMTLGELHRPLDLAYRAATGADWLVHLIGAIVQLTNGMAGDHGWLAQHRRPHPTTGSRWNGSPRGLGEVTCAIGTNRSAR